MRIILLHIFLAASALYAQSPLIKFEKVYGAWSHERGNACVQTWDSGYVVAGSSSSYGNGATGLYLLKLNKYGNFVWHQSFGDVNIDVGTSVVESSDSGLVSVGYTNSYGNGGYDLWVVKTDKNGNLLWQKTYGGSDWDFGYWIGKAAGNGFIVTGSTKSFGAGNSDIWVLRLDSNGDTLWTRTYGGADEDEGAEIIELSSGDFYLTGKTKSFGSGGYDIISMKLGGGGDTTGGQGWHRIFGGNLDDEGTAVTVNSSNELVTQGNTNSVGFGSSDAIHIRYDQNGNFLTYFTMYLGLFETHYSVLYHESGNYVAFGDRGVSASAQHEFRLDIFGPGGWYVGSSDIGGSQNESGSQLIRAKDGGFFAVGTTLSYGNGLTDIYVIKTDSNGIAGGPIAVGAPEEILPEQLLKLFPNPSRGSFSVYFPDMLVVDWNSVKVFDISGRMVEYTIHDRLINLNGAHPGHYIVQVVTDRGLRCLPLVIIE